LAQKQFSKYASFIIFSSQSCKLEMAYQEEYHSFQQTPGSPPRTPQPISRLPRPLSVGERLKDISNGPSSAPPLQYKTNIDAERVAMAQAAAAAAYDEAIASYSKPPPLTPDSPPRYIFGNTSSLSNGPDAGMMPSYSPPQTSQGSTSPTGSNPELKKAEPKKTSLYKTELCRSWEESGNCRYGNKCQVCYPIAKLIIFSLLILTMKSETSIVTQSTRRKCVKPFGSVGPARMGNGVVLSILKTLNERVTDSNPLHPRSSPPSQPHSKWIRLNRLMESYQSPFSIDSQALVQLHSLLRGSLSRRQAALINCLTKSQTSFPCGRRASTRQQRLVRSPFRIQSPPH
jgi:hypothetical protein